MNDCAARPTLDEPELEKLRAMIGVAALRELVAECLADVAEAVARAQNAVQTADGSGVRRAAHKMAGVLGQFGCPRAACMARALAETADDMACRLAEPTLVVVRESALDLQTWANG